MQSDWRWCNKCQGLAFSVNQRSVCPAGGSHDHNGSGNYALAIDDPTAKGQSGWRWCNKCQGLAFSEGLVRPTVCPAGGSHDYSDSGNYTMPHDELSGQPGWRWCNKCQGLAFSLNEPSVCPAGGSHDHTGSGNYTLASAAEVASGAASGGLVSEDTLPSGVVSGAYWPGEVEKSKKSGGQVLDTPASESGGDGTAFFYDFLPCSSELRPKHRKLIGLIRTRMGWPSFRHYGHLLHLQATVDEIEGLMSSSDPEDRLDKKRAMAVLQAFDSTGWFVANTSPPKTGVVRTPNGMVIEVEPDDPEIEALGINVNVVGTPVGRAAARSVQVVYNVPPKHTTNSQWPSDKKSRKWAISAKFGIHAVLPLAGGGVEIEFLVKNLTSGREYEARFSGKAESWIPSWSFSAPAPTGIPDWSEFRVDPDPIAASELDGPNAIYKVVGADVPGAELGFEGAHLWLARPTSPEPIALSGVEISAGTPVTGYVAKGTFTVLGPK